MYSYDFYAQGLVEFRGCRAEGFGTTGLLVSTLNSGQVSVDLIENSYGILQMLQGHWGRTAWRFMGLVIASDWAYKASNLKP